MRTTLVPNQHGRRVIGFLWVVVFLYSMVFVVRYLFAVPASHATIDSLRLLLLNVIHQLPLLLIGIGLLIPNRHTVTASIIAALAVMLTKFYLAILYQQHLPLKAAIPVVLIAASALGCRDAIWQQTCQNMSAPSDPD